MSGARDEHRPLVVSSWPLYLAQGEIVTAIDSKARRIADYMPVTVTTPERSLILGGPHTASGAWQSRLPRPPSTCRREVGPETRRGEML